MALVPEDIRAEVVREVTERTIEGWHAARGLNIPDYSYVLHDRDTDDEFGLQMLHTHVFVAGTIENSLGERESHMTHRGQVCTDRGGLNREDNLHRIARQEFELILDRTIGQAWRRTREVEQPEVDMNIAGVHDHDIDF